MLKIRLQRFGKKKAPVYRVAVLEHTSKRDGKPVEILGFYNPKSKELVINTERVKHWQSVGAQASETVTTLIKKQPLHDLATGAYQAKAKSRSEKEKSRTDLLAQSKKNTKAKKKHAEAAAKAKEAKEAPATEEAAAA